MKYHALFVAGFVINDNGEIVTISARRMRYSETENYIRIMEIILGE